MVRRFVVCLLIGFSISVTLNGCGSGREEIPGSPGAPSAQPDESRTAVELAVLEALDYDARQKAARYEPEAGRVVVTVFAGAEEVPAEELRAYEAAAERAAGGLDILVEVSSADPPAED